MNNNIGKPLDNMLGSHWGHFARRMINILYYTALYPMIIKLVMNRVKPSSESEAENQNKHHRMLFNPAYGYDKMIKKAVWMK